MVETTNSPFITKDVRLKQQIAPFTTKDVRLKQQITPFTTKVETTKKTIHHQD
jgi:hypothetical protein